MHHYMMTRGIKHFSDILINDLSAVILPYKMHGQDFYSKLAMRPIQLWEVVFPEPCYDAVMKMLYKTNAAVEQDANNFTKKALMTALRTGLGAQRCAKFDESVWAPMIINPVVGVHPIGIKKDVHQKSKLTEEEKKELDTLIKDYDKPNFPNEKKERMDELLLHSEKENL